MCLTLGGGGGGVVGTGGATRKSGDSGGGGELGVCTCRLICGGLITTLSSVAIPLGCVTGVPGVLDLFAKCTARLLLTVGGWGMVT